jgi:hypothetical protein
MGHRMGTLTRNGALAECGLNHELGIGVSFFNESCAGLIFRFKISTWIWDVAPHGRVDEEWCTP